jgi:hypothetical protein
MHPFERVRKGPPPGVKPVLQLVLRDGWSLARGKRSLVTAQGRSHSLKSILPTGTSIVATRTHPKTTHKSLSDDERYLARHIQVVFPEGADLSSYAETLRRFEPVEEVRIPPQIALP